MPKFAYHAKKTPEEIVKAVIIADNKKSAIQKIAQKGLYLLSVQEVSEKGQSQLSGMLFFLKKVYLKDITNFFRQLSDLLESGLTIVRALDVLERQTHNSFFKNIISDIKHYCMDGNPLSAALEKHKKVFSKLEISMVRSGELGGALGIVLLRLADYNDRQLDLNSKIKSALAYPALMALVGLMTIVILLTFVIPKMMSLFGDLGQNLPVPILILIGISSVVKKFWLLMILLIAGIVIFYKNISTNAGVRYNIDLFKLKIPILGELINKIEVARFSRTLGTLLKNGVPIVEALNVVSETINNFIVKLEIKKSAEYVRKGQSMADSFKEKNIIPLVVTNMIAVGEESGNLERALFKVAQSYERESDAAIKMLMSLLEPMLILVLGAVVGFIVISMLLPIFEINFLAR